MADPQPGDTTPAAGLPQASSSNGAAPADPTRVEPDADADRSTMPAPQRWTGSAAVPPPGPKRARWSRRRTVGEPDGPAARPPDPTIVDPDDWAATPAVDPWADQDTPWDLLPPAAQVLPPTRVEPPSPPAWNGLPATAPPATAAPPPARRRGWRRKVRPAAAAVPVNRVPVAPRPVAPPPVRPPRQARPLPPPPAWRPPVGGPPPAPPAPRRRRRWPRNLALFTLFSVACCCGIPGYFAWPAARQYPVTATLPDSVADLNRRDDGASRRAVEKLTQQLRDAHSSVDDVFAGIYSDHNGKRVTIFGTTGLRLTPAADVDAELQHLTADYAIRNVRQFDLGESGAHQRCGVGRASGTAVVVCAWADHGSLATVLLTRRSVADSAALVGVLRGAVLTRG